MRNGKRSVDEKGRHIWYDGHYSLPEIYKMSICKKNYAFKHLCIKHEICTIINFLKKKAGRHLKV